VDELCSIPQAGQAIWVKITSHNFSDRKDDLTMSSIICDRCCRWIIGIHKALRQGFLLIFDRRHYKAGLVRTVSRVGRGRGWGGGGELSTEVVDQVHPTACSRAAVI